MEDVRVVGRDRLWPRAALKSRDLLPKVVQHGVRRRVTVVRPPMHLTACDDVNSGNFLVEDRGLGCAILRVGHGRHRELSDGDEAIKGFVPVRNAMRADHGRGVLRIPDHLHLAGVTLREHPIEIKCRRVTSAQPTDRFSSPRCWGSTARNRKSWLAPCPRTSKRCRSYDDRAPAALPEPS